MTQAAQLFEQSSATRADAPGWGHAEAYLALGTQLAARGDMLGARNWIEKALIVAPEYKGAYGILCRGLRFTPCGTLKAFRSQSSRSMPGRLS